jgi:hypothetical protein
MPRLLASAWRQNRISGRCWRAKYCRPSIGSVKRYSARSALPGRTLFYHANRPFESDPWKITLACGSHQPCRPATIGIFNTADWCVSNYRGNLPCSRAMRVSRRLGEGATSSNRHLREGSPAHCRGYATPRVELTKRMVPIPISSPKMFAFGRVALFVIRNETRRRRFVTSRSCHTC